MVTSVMEPQNNDGPRDWQNLFPIKRFHYIKVLFHYFITTVSKIIVCYTEDFAILRFHCIASMTNQ